MDGLNLANVVIYARYSSAGQNDQSIDGQLAKCREYAQQRGNPLTLDTVKRILSNERYTGTYRYLDDIVIEDAFPAIVSKELKQKVRVRAGRERQGPRPREADRVVAEYARSYDASGIKPLERQIREADKELDALVDTLIKTTSAAAIAKINERIEAAEARKRSLEDELATLRIASRVEIRKPDIVAWISQFRAGDPADLDYRKKVIELFVNSIYIYDDKIKMFFNAHDSAQITYPEMLALDDLPGSDFGASGVPLRNDLWMSDDRASALISTAKVFLRLKP